MDRFCIRIRERRKHWELTQAELAECVGVSPQVTSNWERGYTQPNKDELYSLAITLKVRADYLIGLIDDPLDIATNVSTVDILNLLESEQTIIYGDYELSNNDKKLLATLIASLLNHRIEERKLTPP